MTNTPKRVVAVLNDLMFTVKIQEAAKRTGLDVVFVKSRQDALTQATERPALIILDLNYTAGEPLGTIEEIKGNPATRQVSLLGYVSHVHADLRKAAQERGCDVVVPRSVFSQKLPEFLERYAGAN